MELLFLQTPDSADDLARLEALLSRREGIERVFLVSVGARPHLDARRLVEDAGVAWEVLSADSEVAALNRGLLLGRSDMLLAKEGHADLGDLVTGLALVMTTFDRAAAVVPSRVELREASEEVVEGATTLQLPLASPVPAPDVGMVLLRRRVINMIGALDVSFGDPWEALADWSLRAQRLGFQTMRAHRALVRLSLQRRLLATQPFSEGLRARHPYFEPQWHLDGEDFACRLAASGVSVHGKRLSVGIDLRHLPEDAINGTGVYAVELCRNLAKHTPSKVVIWVGTTVQEEAVKGLGLNVHRGPSPPDAVDIVHRPAQVFWPRDLRVLIDCGSAFVITYQDLIAWRAASAFGEEPVHSSYQLVSSLAVHSAQAVIAISEHNRREILREFHLPDDSVHTVYHGVDAEVFARRDGAANARALQPLGVSPPFFLCVGSDYAHKNLRVLLAAFARLRSGWRAPGSAPSLVLVGHPSGTVDGAYRQLRDETPPGVRFVGDVSHDALRALYQESVGFVYPSAYEGFGLPLLEAMAASTPIICSDLSSIPEVAGDAALYLRDGSDEELCRRMVEVATSPELRSRLTSAGSSRVRQFTWERSAKGTFEVYERALRSASARSISERRAARRLGHGWLHF